MAGGNSAFSSSTNDGGSGSDGTTGGGGEGGGAKAALATTAAPGELSAPSSSAPPPAAATGAAAEGEGEEKEGVMSGIDAVLERLLLLSPTPSQEGGAAAAPAITVAPFEELIESERGRAYFLQQLNDQRGRHTGDVGAGYGGLARCFQLLLGALGVCECSVLGEEGACREVGGWCGTGMVWRIGCDRRSLLLPMHASMTPPTASHSSLPSFLQTSARSAHSTHIPFAPFPPSPPPHPTLPHTDKHQIRSSPAPLPLLSPIIIPHSHTQTSARPPTTSAQHSRPWRWPTPSFARRRPHKAATGAAGAAAGAVAVWGRGSTFCRW
jgi:hypothetical protein